MVHDTVERAMRCPSCEHVVYPKIMPAVIVGVIHEGKLLTSRYAGRAYGGLALIAGFVEIGETGEDTVRREVMEEVGLKVKNITYFATQPGALNQICSWGTSVKSMGIRPSMWITGSLPQQNGWMRRCSKKRNFKPLP